MSHRMYGQGMQLVQGKIHIRVTVAGKDINQVRGAKKLQHRKVGVRVPAVRRRVNHHHAIRAKKHIACPQVAMDTCRWHIKFASLRMLDDALTRLFHQLFNFRLKTCPARERQHTLLGVKLRPVIRRGARLLNATDVVLSRTAFRRHAKGLCPGLWMPRKILPNSNADSGSGRTVSTRCSTSVVPLTSTTLTTDFSASGVAAANHFNPAASAWAWSGVCVVLVKVAMRLHPPVSFTSLRDRSSFECRWNSVRALPTP